MKFYLPLLLAFSAVSPALGDEATCNQDSQRVNQHQGQKYTKEIASLAKSDTVRVLHPGDAATMDFRPARLNVYLDENDVIRKASCG